MAIKEYPILWKDYSFDEIFSTIKGNRIFDEYFDEVAADTDAENHVTAINCKIGSDTVFTIATNNTKTATAAHVVGVKIRTKSGKEFSYSTTPENVQTAITKITKTSNGVALNWWWRWESGAPVNAESIMITKTNAGNTAVVMTANPLGLSASALMAVSLQGSNNITTTPLNTPSYANQLNFNSTATVMYPMPCCDCNEFLPHVFMMANTSLSGIQTRIVLDNDVSYVSNGYYCLEE